MLASHKRMLGAITAALLMGASPLAMAQGADDAQRLKALYTTEWDWRQKEFAKMPEDDQWGSTADHLPTVSAAAQKARLAYWEQVLAKLKTIDPGKLDAEEEVNYQVYKASLEAMASNIRFKTYEAPFNSDSNFWSDLQPRSGGFSTAEQYQRYISRMRDLPRNFDEHIVNMRSGIKRGYTVPKVTLAGRDNTIVPFTNPDVEANPFYAAFKQMPAAIASEDQARLRAEAKLAIKDQIIPAYSKLLTFMRQEYVPQARTTIAAEALPDGKAFYRSQIKEYTTLDLSPDQVHQIGLDEVARISAAMDETMKRSGFKGSKARFVEFLRTDPQFYPKSSKELLSYVAYVTKRFDGRLKDTFGVLPRYRFTIRQVPDLIAPYYTSARGSLEACIFNTYDLKSRPLYQLTAMALHECVPGHSFQYAYLREMPGRPEFRKRNYFSALGEGWGMYSEYLGVELGMYETPYDEYGRLSFEMWRACRLVVDTGIHSKGWTRQQAVDYLLQHTAHSRAEIETEIDRYISWPGQADSYKIGELTILRARKKAEAALGDRFDPRTFHDTLLALGSVPMAVLEKRVDEYIAGGGKAITPRLPE